MKKVYYEKIGRKYVPVSEYDSDFLDSLKKGTHLVMSYPGGRSFKYNVEPAYAPMIAAGRVCEDVISNAIMRAHEARPYQNTVLNNEQLAAWEHLQSVLGDRGRYIEWPSAREVTEAAVKVMSEEAIKLFENPSVKMAYDHFQLVCDLAKDVRSD
jgi:hypothetical protein